MYKEQDAVIWNWKGAKLKGTVIEIYTEPVIKQLKGAWIKRNGSPENPAYFIRKDNTGAFVLKLHSELWHC